MTTSWMDPIVTYIGSLFFSNQIFQDAYLIIFVQMVEYVFFWFKVLMTLFTRLMFLREKLTRNVYQSWRFLFELFCIFILHTYNLFTFICLLSEFKFNTTEDIVGIWCKKVETINFQFNTCLDRCWVANYIFFFYIFTDTILKQ